MAAPNIVGVTTITGKTDVTSIDVTATAITTNSAASNQVYKINSLIISNIDGTNDADVTVEFVRGGTGYALASVITVPAAATLVIVSKDNGIYMEEGDSIECTASAAGDLQAILSYDIITDQ